MDLHKLYQELKDFERQKAEVDAAAGAFTEDGRIKGEIGKIGSQLYAVFRKADWRNRRSGKKKIVSRLKIRKRK